MSENQFKQLGELLTHTEEELTKFAKALRAAECGDNATMKAAREGTAEGLDDRAAQCRIWRGRVAYWTDRGMAPSAAMEQIRLGCDEFLRMIGNR